MIVSENMIKTNKKISGEGPGFRGSSTDNFDEPLNCLF
jgi:hypothetical protein